MVARKVFGRDVECFVQVFELFALGFWNETLMQCQQGRAIPRGGEGYAQVYENQAYDAPGAIPHEGSEGSESFHIARPGDADDEVEKP